MTGVPIAIDEFWRSGRDAAVRAVAGDGEAWPLKTARRGRLRRRETLALCERSGDLGVFDAAARPRVARTLALLGRSVPEYVVGEGGRDVRTTDLELGERGLEEGVVHLVRHARPEPDGVGVDAAWERIERWLAEHRPAGAATLRDGAGEDAVAAAEAAIGRSFPDALRRSLARHDGQESDDGGLALGRALAEGHRLLTAAEIPGDWRTSRDVSADLGADDDWWKPAWIPFTEDGGGDAFCVDADTGEVVHFVHDGHAEVVAASLEGWVARWAAELESGEQVVDPETGDVVALYIAS